jgi:hypothetical protein
MKKHHHTTSRSRQRKPSAGVSVTHVLKVFMLHLVSALALAGWINYTSYEVFNPLLMAFAAFAAAVLATAVHVYRGQRNVVDDFADDDL